jgi:molybdopterin synthase catalytic subunit
MRRELTISEKNIDERALLGGRAMSAGMGAAVYFLGIVRGAEEGGPIAALEYEAFRQMAERQFHLVFDQAETRWPLESVRLVHRLGRVAAGETSLWIEVIAPHLPIHRFGDETGCPHLEEGIPACLSDEQRQYWLSCLW